jgi:hypothetical protein
LRSKSAASSAKKTRRKKNNERGQPVKISDQQSQPPSKFFRAAHDFLRATRGAFGTQCVLKKHRAARGAFEAQSVLKDFFTALRAKYPNKKLPPPQNGRV